MALDAVCIRALTLETANKIVGGRIDKIHQPEKDEIVIHIRTREESFRLVLSASPAHPRLHFTDTPKKNPVTAPMFCMLLRKHLGSGKIIAVTQEGFERTVKISVESYDELGDLTVKHIIIEIMGRHSNIILVNNDMKIIDSIKRVDFTVSSVRQILPGLDYVSPPAQDKTPLIEVVPETELDFSLPKRAFNVLLDAVCGISPLTAREIVYRAFSRTDITTADLNLNKQSALKAELVRFSQKVRQNDFSPCLIVEKGTGKMLDFSSFMIEQYGDMADIVPCEGISAMLDKFYGTRDMHERMRQKSAGLVKLLSNNIERINKKLIILQRTVNDAKNKDKYKIYGELVTSAMHQIKDGDKSVEVINYYEEDMPSVTIPLDVRLSPSQNAQHYFKKYTKAKIAETEAAKQIEGAKNELYYLESTLTAAENAETESDLNAIRTELIAQGYLNRRRDSKKQKQPQAKPLHFVSSDGFDIYVGKNNTQNDYLTTKLANSSDIWFHTKNIHGSHTVIKLGLDKDVPKTTLMEAAQLAAYYSKARASSQVPVDYTQIKNVKKPAGAKPGMVIYDRYNTVYVTPKTLKN
ncbi:MAG: NFACT RNA binding domain-containing protein [Clostridiales bacterium]|nr:NFACT RNA binding domain-containing protein [Clostridiales bacterium]